MKKKSIKIKKLIQRIKPLSEASRKRMQNTECKNPNVPVIGVVFNGRTYRAVYYSTHDKTVYRSQPRKTLKRAAKDRAKIDIALGMTGNRYSAYQYLRGENEINNKTKTKAF